MFHFSLFWKSHPTPTQPVGVTDAVKKHKEEVLLLKSLLKVLVSALMLLYFYQYLCCTLNPYFMRQCNIYLSVCGAFCRQGRAGTGVMVAVIHAQCTLNTAPSTLQMHTSPLYTTLTTATAGHGTNHTTHYTLHIAHSSMQTAPTTMHTTQQPHCK